MKNLTRRSFLKISGISTASLCLPASSWAQVNGANNDIRVAVVGFNGQGGSHIEGFRKTKGVRVVALCDVDEKVLNGAAQKFKDLGESIETYTDVRKLLENKDIDAISTATPNHWHALVSIWACQAGKDVYVEKPVSHNVWEGRQIVVAARKYNRIVQTGTQCRSNPAIREAMQYLHEGNLGKIKIARGLCYKRRDSIGKVNGAQPVPEGIDYDLWCGPAPKVPLMRRRLHYDWHWVWPTGNGDLGNQGIHHMDLARWALQKTGLSPKVFSVGGRFGYVDDGTTPNTQVIYHDYGDSLLIFEVRGLPEQRGAKNMDKYRGTSVGLVVECQDGYVVMPSYTEATAFDNDGKELKKFKGGASHHANFINAVRSRKYADLTADILEGHLSSALCHTGNISYLLGKCASPDEVGEEIKSNSEALEACQRAYEHLQLNEVDLEKNPPVLGAFLQMDPRTERFVNNTAANQLLRREYRKPFVVPDQV